MFICNKPEPWAKLSAWQLRMIAMSSTHSASWGNSDETSMPDWPCLENFHRLPSSGWPLVRLASNRGSFSRFGIGWPSRLVSSGLGSNSSTWLGPAVHEQKDAALGLAERSAAAGASPAKPAAVSAAAARLLKPSWASSQVERRADEPAASLPDELAPGTAARRQPRHPIFRPCVHHPVIPCHTAAASRSYFTYANSFVFNSTRQNAARAFKSAAAPAI